MRLLRIFVNQRVFIALLVIAAWLGLEVGGKGTGVLKWLVSPAPTRDTGFHPVDLLGARPKGPVRLSSEEAGAIEARLVSAFQDRKMPAYGRTSQMREYAGDPFFNAVLATMHASTEHLLWWTPRADASGPGRGEPVPVAVFAGRDGKLKIAFDLRKVRGHAWFESYTAKTSDGSSPVPSRLASDHVLIVDDPGPLRYKGAIVPAIFIYGGTNPPENNIMGLVSQGDFAERQRFFAAVLGRSFSEAEADVPRSTILRDFPKTEAKREGDGVAAGLGAARKKALQDREACHARGEEDWRALSKIADKSDAQNKAVDAAVQCERDFAKAMRDLDKR